MRGVSVSTQVFGGFSTWLLETPGTAPLLCTFKRHIPTSGALWFHGTAAMAVTNLPCHTCILYIHNHTYTLHMPRSPHRASPREKASRVHGSRLFWQHFLQHRAISWLLISWEPSNAAIFPTMVNHGSRLWFLVEPQN